MRFWLETYDFNLPLLDVLDDPDIADVRAQLAGLSLGEGLDSGYFDAAELADAVARLWIEREDRVRNMASEARHLLADLLNRDDNGYVGALYDVTKALIPAEAARHLRWLADLMKLRADMYQVAQAAGIATPAVPGR